jgi:hypothetical protein
MKTRSSDGAETPYVLQMPTPRPRGQSCLGLAALLCIGAGVTGGLTLRRWAFAAPAAAGLGLIGCAFWRGRHWQQAERQRSATMIGWDAARWDQELTEAAASDPTWGKYQILSNQRWPDRREPAQELLLTQRISSRAITVAPSQVNYLADLYGSLGRQQLLRDTLQTPELYNSGSSLPISVMVWRKLCERALRDNPQDEAGVLLVLSDYADLWDPNSPVVMDMLQYCVETHAAEVAKVAQPVLMKTLLDKLTTLLPSSRDGFRTLKLSSTHAR